MRWASLGPTTRSSLRTWAAGLPPRFASVPNCYPSFEVFLHIPNLEDIFSRYAVFHVTRAKLAETMPGTRCMLCSAEIGEHP